jgi:hypothetical protein
MKPEEILRIVDAIHRDKNIDKEVVFQAIEAALVTALSRQYGETAQITIAIDRTNGRLTGMHDGAEIDTAELSGRIGAQTAKQVIIQKIREASGSGTTTSQSPTQSPHGSRSCSTTLRAVPPLSVFVHPRESDQYLTKTLQYYSQSDQ